MLKRGRPRQPIKILQLHDSRYAKTRVDLPNDSKRPEFPKYLNEQLRPVWDDMVEKLERLGILDSIDQMMITLYCNDFDDYWNADKKCKDLTIVTSKGTEIQNPLVGIRKGLQADAHSPYKFESLSGYSYSVLRLRIQPTRPAPRLPSKIAPGAGTTETVTLSIADPQPVSISDENFNVVILPSATNDH
jgi:P27 family predicted phage terminase small subunit